MAPRMQNAKISCRGGLDLRSTTQELLSLPGYAYTLQNFEPVNSGGYRRINGYTTFGTNPVPGTGMIKGIYIFSDSILVARGQDLYHTFDASTWVQVNKNVTDANLATINAAAAVPLDDTAEEVKFAHYSNGTAAGDEMVTIVNGVDQTMHFIVTGTDHNNATYTFKFLDNALTAAPIGCKYCYAFRDQIYQAGKESDPSTIYVSSLFDPEDYTGTNSLQISTADPVKGIYPFRESMIVFCENSLFSLSGVNSGQPVLTPITENIGCIDGNTVKEIGGDLIFLAADGLRTVAATDRIDDVELSAVSSLIYPITLDINTSLEDLKLSSVVLREKNQYRLYYSDMTRTGTSGDKGIIGTLGAGANGELGWSWGTTKGISARFIDEGLFKNKFISIMSTKQIDEEGILYQHDIGNTLNGNAVDAVFTTPFFDLGDPSFRKNIHRVKTYIRAFGQANIRMRLEFTGYSNELPHSPKEYALGEIRIPAVYGVSDYGSAATYGSRVVDAKYINTEGSGFTMSVTYSSRDTGAPYNIQGFDLDFTPAGKV